MKCRPSELKELALETSFYKPIGFIRDQTLDYAIFILSKLKNTFRKAKQF